MDKKKAKRILEDHSKALEVLLESDGMANVKAEAEEAIESASEGTKALKRSLLDRVKDLPVVQKVSELGTAGTIAVSTAAVAQTELATDLTQVFIADVAQDAVEERFEVPQFIDTFVDFDQLHTWGQEVIASKVSELQSTSQPSVETSDPKPEPSSSSQGTSDDTPSQSKPTESSQEQEQQKSETKEDKSSKQGDQKGDKESKQQQSQEQQTEDKKESQETKSSSEGDTKSEPVKFIETPIETLDDIKPHQLRQVSPVN